LTQDTLVLVVSVVRTFETGCQSAGYGAKQSRGQPLPREIKIVLGVL
jgi:hypothetical protein